MTLAPSGVGGVVVKVLLVCGSLQRRSANRAALEAIEDSLLRRGAVVDDFDRVGDLPLFDAGRVDDEIESVDAWRARVDAADAIAIASPEYAGGLAGSMKNALDWLVGTGNLYDKPVAIISAGTSGGQHARAQLARTLAWQGAYVIAELGIAVPRTKSDPEGRLVDPATLASIDVVAAAVVRGAMAPEADLVSATRAVLASFGIESGRWRSA